MLHGNITKPLRYRGSRAARTIVFTLNYLYGRATAGWNGWRITFWRAPGGDSPPRPAPAPLSGSTGNAQTSVSVRHPLFAGAQSAHPVCNAISPKMKMAYFRRRCACRLAVLLLAGLLLPATANAQSFPFGSELMLDQAPMRGSKRVPMLEIEENGAASIDLWCASAPAEATVGGDSISIVPGQVASTPEAAQCAPERQANDTSLLAALAQVTAWKREGDVIELFGPTPLRFRLMTN